MDTIEESLTELLAGSTVTDEMVDIVDLTLADQLSELASKGIESNAVPDYKPVVNKSVSFIVAVVLFNECDEILMMQEAKSRCAGTWYLPAGRMEPGEELIEAAKREVLEETGLEFDPTTLLMVETAQGQWYRFIFTGLVTGGELKTVSRADAESLQANWIGDLSLLNLRANDILPLVEKARAYHHRGNQPWHSLLLPTSTRHYHQLLMRLVVIIRKKANNRIHVLVNENVSAHFPTCEIHPTRNFHSSIKKFMQDLFGENPPPHKPQGVLSVEYRPSPAPEENESKCGDGLCLTIFVPCKNALEDVSLKDGYTWLEVSPTMGNQLLGKMAKNMTLELHVIR